VPVLALLLVASADFARVFYFSIAVNNAASAGAQYGSQTLATASDINGMKNAATQDAPNLPTLAATAQLCTCGTGSSVTACATSYCTNNPRGNFVEVDTTMTFNTIVTYPGIRPQSPSPAKRSCRSSSSEDSGCDAPHTMETVARPWRNSRWSQVSASCCCSR